MTMCKATLFATNSAPDEPGHRAVELSTGEGKTPALALIRLSGYIKKLPNGWTSEPSGVDVTNEDGLVAFTARGTTAEEALKEAKAMHNKAARGGGR